jgi:hypothetical protein
MVSGPVLSGKNKKYLSNISETEHQAHGWQHADVLGAASWL